MAINLNKPSVGSTDWGMDVNNNFSTIENCLNGSASIGPLGIGTASPTHPIHVYSSTAHAFTKLQTSYASGYSGLHLLTANNHWVIQHTYAGHLQFMDYDTGVMPFCIESEAAGNTMRLTTAGYVGIGTASPVAKLDVRGSAIFNEDGADADFRIEGDADANLLFCDASADKIGIGTNTPNEKLNIAGNVNVNLGSGYKVNGTQVVGAQQSHIADAKTDYTTGDLDTEAKIIAAFNATNGKINSILAALEAHGLLASA